MSIRYTTLIIFLWIIDAQHGVEADVHLNSTETFGADALKEMPLMTGAGLSQANPACESTFEAIALTPKAFRVYVFKQSEEKSQATVEAHSTQQSREITFGTDLCQAVLIVSRSERGEAGNVDLQPGSGSGVPGAELKDVLNERNMFITGAYFPTTKADCGTSDMSFQFDQFGLMLLTSLGNSPASSSKLSKDHYFRSVTFSHGDCSTKVDFHFYMSIDGKPSQLEQR